MNRGNGQLKLRQEKRAPWRIGFNASLNAAFDIENERPNKCMQKYFPPYTICKTANNVWQNFNMLRKATAAKV